MAITTVTSASALLGVGIARRKPMAMHKKKKKMKKGGKRGGKSGGKRG